MYVFQGSNVCVCVCVLEGVSLSKQNIHMHFIHDDSLARFSLF